MSTKNRLSAGERKQAIIEAAIRLFSEKGFRGVTTRELAQAVGVSEPVLYQHFQTKQEIYSGILDSMSADLEAKVGQTRALIANPELTDREILRSMAMAMTQWYVEKPEFCRLLHFGALEAQEFSQLFFARHASLHFEILKNYFDQAMAGGRFRHVSSATAVWVFLGMVIHHQNTLALQHFNPYPQPIEQTLDEMLDLFLNGILAGAQSA
ncbi:hypothetical protein F183_A18090 [Bryobacterales bacterium F-183]|nr:hypothetical protein F183_A18090 [Bryobacterales bacterium F-183]